MRRTPAALATALAAVLATTAAGAGAAPGASATTGAPGTAEARNNDEPPILDHNTEDNPPELYRPDAYRSSDHDPVLVGLRLR